MGREYLSRSSMKLIASTDSSRRRTGGNVDDVMRRKKSREVITAERSDRIRFVTR